MKSSIQDHEPSLAKKCENFTHGLSRERREGNNCSARLVKMQVPQVARKV